MPRHQLQTFGGTMLMAVNSGQVAPVQTGLFSQGGAAALVGSDIMFFSGAGRLGGAFLHQYATSGLPIIFYDAAAPVSGGPVATSGHKIIGILPAVFSGGTQTLPGTGGISIFGTPFTSGLCVNSRSGQNGFTVTWTPENPFSTQP